jgi:hypothetical protein
MAHHNPVPQPIVRIDEQREYDDYSKSDSPTSSTLWLIPSAGYNSRSTTSGQKYNPPMAILIACPCLSLYHTYPDQFKGFISLFCVFFNVHSGRLILIYENISGDYAERPVIVTYHGR